MPSIPAVDFRLKSLLLGLALALMFGCGVQGNGQTPVNRLAKGTVPFELEGQIEQFSGDSLHLYEAYGSDKRLLASFAVVRQGQTAQFSIKGKLPAAGGYFLGQDANTGLDLLLGADPRVKLTANAQNYFGSAAFSEGTEAMAVHTFLARVLSTQGQQQQLAQQAQQLNMQGKGPEAQALMQQQQNLQTGLNAFVEETLKKTGWAARYARVFHYPAYNPATTGQGMANEMEYFRKRFIGWDLADSSFAYIPLAANKLQAYARQLLEAVPAQGGFVPGLDLAGAQAAFEPLLAQTPAGSKWRLLALNALVMGAAQAKGNPQQIDLYCSFAERLSREFPNDEYTKRYAQDLQRFGRTLVGKPMPNIEQPGPDGQVLKLSDLKGKYVLVDFWASWCGPCRRENPFMRDLYARFKPKGFEIFSVSLDSDSEKWKQAIAADQLTWPWHVSLLKGWQNPAYEQFGAGGIPFTVLVGPDGSIVAKGLRGHELEARLKVLLP